MDWLHAIVLAILQGLTEFLPISSSAHLILVPKLIGWPDQGLAYDVAVHLGTLFAVLWYFRLDVRRLFNAWFAQVLRSESSQDSKLAWAVVVGTIPILVFGLFVNDYQEILRNPLLIAATTIVFAIALWVADRHPTRGRDEYSLSLRDVLVVGVAQAIALIPGTSRSGITITAALMLGLDRNSAARFSFLLSIPVIFCASALKFWELVQTTETVAWMIILIGVAISGFTAYLSIHFFLKLIARVGLSFFVIYRLLLGGFLIYVFI